MIDVPTRVKDALREGDRLKRYRFVVDSDPVITITNDNLVSESVTFDERMCSDKEIKFGLCEGTNLEFQYFGLPNITGKRLQAFIDVQYKDSDGVLKWYEIPMGWFEVSESSRQASTGIIKVSAYNKLLSDYLDAKANDAIIETTQIGIMGRQGSAALSTILDNLLNEYSVERSYTYSAFDNVLYDRSIYAQYYLRMESKAIGFMYSTYRVYVDDFSTEKIYRIWMNCKKIYDKVISYVPSELYEKYVGELYYDEASDEWHANNFGNLKDKLAYEDEHSLPMYIRVFVSGAGSQTFYINNRNKTNESLFSDWMTNINLQQNVFATILFPVFWKTIDFDTAYVGTNPYMNWTEAETEIAKSRVNEIIYNLDYMSFQEQITSEIEDIIFTTADAQALPDVTLRDLQSASFETVCQYGKLDRETDLFSGVELNNSRLLPAEDLYPANDLYPNSIAERSNPAMYSKLWADEGNVRKFRYLIITYKGTETEGGQTREVEKTLQRTVDENGTDDYNMSNNWLFKNLVWTDEEIEDYADAMVAKMQNLTWFPFEMWCAGLPYVETGDELEINVNGEAYTSYVLRRNLRGIQNLQDEMINGELDIF